MYRTDQDHEGHEGRHPPPQPPGRGDGRHAPRYQRDDCRVHGGPEGRGRSDDIFVRLRDLRLITRLSIRIN